MDDSGDGLSQDEVSDEDVREARNQEILRLYETKSAAEISNQLGISAALVYRITAQEGLKKKRGRPKKTFQESILSPDHLKIGNRFAHHTSWIMKLENVEVAKALGWSPQKVSMIGKGNYDLTLTDLKIMATFIGTTVSALTKEI